MKRCSTSLAWREIQTGHDGKTPPIHSDEGQLQRWTMGERNQNPGALLGEWIMVPAPVGSTQARPQKVIHSHHMDLQFSFWVDNSKELKTGAQKNKTQQKPHTHSQLHYSHTPKVETQVSTDNA